MIHACALTVRWVAQKSYVDNAWSDLVDLHNADMAGY
jgi:hypothetical protein